MDGRGEKAMVTLTDGYEVGIRLYIWETRRYSEHRCEDA